MSPDAPDVVSLFFQSAPKILYCQRGRAAAIPSRPPIQIHPSDEGFEFLQHSFVDGRITDDTATFVHFRFTRFKLRFDERDNFAVWFNKATAGGKIFCREMNEQSITARSADANGWGNLLDFQVAGHWFFP